ncbi:MAG: VTT domain-containing protein [Chloroflexi bacterium]|nr:VTT domain-containing protein [Chloroflexota bacterium]
MTDHVSSAAASRPVPVRPITPPVELRPSGDQQPEAPPAKRSVWKLVLTLLALGAMSGLFLFFPIDWDKVGNWGYVGVFGVVFVATASVALPIPYLFIVARAALYLDPFGVTLVAGIAGALGELSGYVLGASGRELFPQNKVYDRANHLMVKYGFWCVVFFAFVPNPVFDAIGFAAGVLKYPLWRFLLACFLGKSMKFAMAAFAVPMIRFTCLYLPDACGWVSHGPLGRLVG